MRDIGLHILIVGPYPLHDGKIVGGVEAVNATLAPALAQQPDVGRVTVLSFQRGRVTTPARQVSDKLYIRYVRGQRRPFLTRAALELWHARRVAAELKPDIVHGHGIGIPGDVVTQLGKPAVVTVHGLEHIEARLAAQRTNTGHFRTRLVEATVKRVLDRARVVISISKYDTSLLDGLVRGQLVSIPNPVSPQFFERPRFDLDGNRVLFAGVHARRKNLEGLLRAFARAKADIPGARLIMVGPTLDVAYAQELHALVDTLQIRDAVKFLGHVENEQLIEELRACKVVTLFSHEETSPTILAQAMAIGKPIIASRVGGIPELVIEQENGFLVERRDEQAFAARLQTLLGSSELCTTMGRRAHEIALDRCEPCAVARKTIAAYQLAQAIALRPQRVPA